MRVRRRRAPARLWPLALIALLAAQSGFAQVDSLPTEVCPGATPFVGNLGLWNGSGTPVTLPSNTVVTWTFSAPVANIPAMGYGGGFSVAGTYSVVSSGNAVTISMSGGATLPASPTSGFTLIGTQLDLRGVPDRTNITATLTMQPPNALGGIDAHTPVVVARTNAGLCQAPAETVDDVLAPCPTPREIADFNSALQITFEADPTAPTLVCRAADGSEDLTLLQASVYRILRIMRRLRFDAPLPWTDKPLYDWFVGAIKGIRFVASGFSECCDPAHVIIISVPANSYLVLTGRWVDPSLGGGLMHSMVLFMHEARHSEGYVHDCGNNDETLAQLGAWGIQMYAYEWLAMHSGSFMNSSSAFLGSNSPISSYRDTAWRGIDLACFCDAGRGITASPESVDFGEKPIRAGFQRSAGDERVVAVSSTRPAFNIGFTDDAIPATVAASTVSGTNSDDFRIVATDCTDALVPPSCTVRIRFVPLATGPRRATLEITTASSGSFAVLLTGTGTPGFRREPRPGRFPAK